MRKKLSNGADLGGGAQGCTNGAAVLYLVIGADV